MINNVDQAKSCKISRENLNKGHSNVPIIVRAAVATTGKLRAKRLMYTSNNLGIEYLSR